jgi:hypothetical protein
MVQMQSDEWCEQLRLFRSIHDLNSKIWILDLDL